MIDQVVDAGAAQRHRRAHAAEARADDRDLGGVDAASPPAPSERANFTAGPHRESRALPGRLARQAARMSAYSVGPPKKKLPCRVLASALPSRL